MKSWETLGRTRTPDGTELTLARHPDEYVILANGQPLMSSRMHGSEEALAMFGCRRASTLRKPCVLVGGLGMGFTLRAALDSLPPDAVVLVVELVPAIVEWNHGPLGALANQPLNDPRVLIEEGDVATTVGSSNGRFDAVLLDVDNGPAALTDSSNVRLYSDRGIAAVGAALRAGGVLAVWSARENHAFARRLRRGGFSVQGEHVRGRQKRGGPRHTILIAHDRQEVCEGR